MDLAFNWKPLLARSAKVAMRVHGQVKTFPPASETQILAAEARLGVALPPSLRKFYLETNGWGLVGFIWGVLPIERIGWMRDVEPELYELIEGSLCDPGAERCLVVSSEGDAAYWLLDPAQIDARGEWLAGRWASWHPAVRFNQQDFFALFESEVAFTEQHSVT